MLEFVKEKFQQIYSLKLEYSYHLKSDNLDEAKKILNEITDIVYTLALELSINDYNGFSVLLLEATHDLKESGECYYIIFIEFILNSLIYKNNFSDFFLNLNSLYFKDNFQNDKTIEERKNLKRCGEEVFKKLYNILKNGGVK